MKNQVIYSSLGVYAGPAPSSTGHFIAEDGQINNSWSIITGNNSLVFPLNRVIQTSYSVTPPRTPISHLGDYGAIARPILDPPEIIFNVSYHLMGLINEMRLGLLANIPTSGGDGMAMLYGTGNVSLLSGLYTRDYSPTIELGYYNWPLNCREPKNMFVAVKKDGGDLNDRTSGTILQTLYKNTSVDVYGFGDCYLRSYNCSASVGQIPTVSIEMSSTNIEVYSSGLCCDIPSVNPITYNIRSGTKFSIPNNFEGAGLPTVMLPRDISLSIKQRSNNSANLTDALADFTDLKIQSFNFNFNLNRSPLYSLGTKIPYDQKITVPVISKLDFNSFMGDSKAGSLASLVRRDEEYDISIRLNYQNRSFFDGVGICYNFFGAKLDNISSSSSISSRQSFNMSFSTQLDPKGVNNGVFMTGYLGIPNGPTDLVYLSDDFDGGGIDILLMENGDLFLLGMTGYRLLY